MPEWVDIIMGRWDPMANTHFGGKSEKDITGHDAKGRHLGELAVLEKPDDKMTPEKAIIRIRAAVADRIPIGGLIKCWTEFRQRAGAAKHGILYEEFSRALRAYGILMPPEERLKLFHMMDTNHDGTIQMREFIDVVMGRWNPEANTHFGSKSAADIKGRDTMGETRGRAAMIEHIDENMTCEDAIEHLRTAITQRIKSCNQGELIRCWIEFRTKAGSNKEGITLPEFRRGLRMYGIPLTKERTKEFFQMFDKNGDNQMHMSEFINIVISRKNPRKRRGQRQPANGSDMKPKMKMVLSENPPCQNILHKPATFDCLPALPSVLVRLLLGRPIRGSPRRLLQSLLLLLRKPMLRLIDLWHRPQAWCRNPQRRVRSLAARPPCQ